MSEAIEVAALRLRDAQRSGAPCVPVRDLLDPGDVDAAYAVQAVNCARRVEAGHRGVGWKIGLTSRVVQAQLGVDQPDFGRLFADNECFDDLPIALGSFLQPRVEAEIAFVLGRDLDVEVVSVVDVVNATAYVLPAIEIVDSRVADWNITLVDTIADNASGCAYVLGARPRPLTALDLRTVAMEMSGPDGVVSSGSGAACLGHPVNAVAWLAATMSRLGSPLRAGDLVLSGALGPMVPVVSGACYEAVISDLGSVRARFE